MTVAPLWIVADASSRTYYELVRLFSMDQWWHWMLLSTVVVAVVALIALLYHIDSRELPRGTRWLLLTLRVVAFVGLLIFFLDLEKRTERKVVKNSRAILLVDTSQSMGLADADATPVPAGTSRVNHVITEFAEGQLLADLRQQHDVVVYRFDQTASPVEVASLPKTASPDAAAGAAASLDARSGSLREMRILLAVAAALLLVSLLAVASHWVLGARVLSVEGQSWALLIGVVVLVVAVVTVAVANLRNPQVGFAWALGLGQPPSPAGPTAAGAVPTADGADQDVPVDWKSLLRPRGSETRLGDAVRFLVDKQRGGPIAGIVLFSDGRRNAGIEHTVAIEAARDAKISVYGVGLGSDRRPLNVRVVDLEAPARVYPGDSYTMTGYLQSYGLVGRSVKVELFSVADENAGGDSAERFEVQRHVQLVADGETLPVKFEITPQDAGRRVYRLRVVPPDRDHDSRDNEKTAQVEVVERKNRVLLLAGGPTREYRFVRNLLYRDRDTTVDVLLQTAKSGISQEADDILFGFPTEADDLFQYDCIMAFDPDWRMLDASQARLLDRWVAEKAGGLVVIAGPVFTPQWAERRGSDEVIDVIRGLYPVVFYGRGSAGFQLGRTTATSAWPLQFSEEGLNAQFLWLDDTALASEQTWAGFDGVYSYYAVKDAKPGAKVYCRFSDPQTAVDSDLPIYMAGHFYGAGRVFYLGSGELWRLRAVDETDFEQVYTKLLRHVSQGRLLRDSSRGVLLVGKQRCLLGENVTVRAALTDRQHNPLTDAAVQAVLIQPDSIRQNLTLHKLKDAAREGMYSGQFAAVLEGDYRIELPVPDSEDDELLTGQVRVRVPELEIERPERNDALLADLSRSTGGSYFVGMDAALGRRGIAPLTTALPSMDQETFLPPVPDKDFDRRLMTWLLTLICGALCLEWLVRRLNKLA